MIRWKWLFWGFLLAGPAVADVQEAIRQEEQDFGGRLGVCARRLDTGEEIRYRAGQKFPTASSIKTAVMMEFFIQQAQGKVDLDDPTVVLPSEMVGGSGDLQAATGPVRTDYRDIIEKMITISDNTATNEAVDAVGGLWDGIYRMNERLRTFGLKNTRLLNKMMWFKTKTQSPDSLRNGVGVTTPEDMALLYELIAKGEIVNRETSEEMIAILKRQKYNSIIPGQLPMEEIPEIGVAHKTGSVGNAVIDAGIVSTPKFDYVIALFADGTDEEQWQRMLAGREPMAIPGDNENWPGVSAASKKLTKISWMIFNEFYGWTEQEGKTK